jgi:DNA modification methylase
MLIRGDARQLPLADRVVDCIVTSPPYWGLRDYGTATWAGGDPSCVHTGVRPPGIHDKSATNKGSSRDFPTLTCRLCGAGRIDAQIGLEATPEAYVAAIVAVFRELARVLKDDGTAWLNLGDSYAGTNQPARLTARPATNGRGELQIATAADCKGRADLETQHNLKPKDLVGIPWRIAFALQADGWYLRSDIIWHKPNPMPESVTDRPTKAHEYVFLLSKSERYTYDADAIAEATVGRTPHDLTGPGVDAPGSMPQRGSRSGNLERVYGNGRSRPGSHLGASVPWEGRTRNKRSVWTIPTLPYSGAHFATMPPALVTPCILAGCPLGGLVLDPFIGSGTVGAVAEQLGRRWIGLDLSYHALAQRRTAQRGLFVASAPTVNRSQPKDPPMPLKQEQTKPTEPTEKPRPDHDLPRPDRPGRQEPEPPTTPTKPTPPAEPTAPPQP